MAEKSKLAIREGNPAPARAAPARGMAVAGIARAPLALKDSTANTWLTAEPPAAASHGVVLFIWGPDPAVPASTFPGQHLHAACTAPAGAGTRFLQRGRISSETSMVGTPKFLRETREPCRVPGLCWGRICTRLWLWDHPGRELALPKAACRESEAKEIIAVQVLPWAYLQRRGGEGRQGSSSLEIFTLQLPSGWQS